MYKEQLILYDYDDGLLQVLSFEFLKLRILKKEKVSPIVLLQFVVLLYFVIYWLTSNV